MLRELRKAGITAEMIIAMVKRGGGGARGPDFPIGPQGTPQFGGSTVVIVEITGASTGGGVYECIYQVRPPEIDDIDKTQNVSEDMIGDFTSTGSGDSESFVGYAFNMNEEGQNTHDITDDTQTIKRFIGVYIGNEKSDGRPCFAINGFDVETCSEPA